MADEGYPFPGTSQITTAHQWESFFSSVQLDGVAAGLAPTLNAGARTAVLAAGAAMIKGFYKPVTSATATPIPVASVANRVDRLVMRLDRGAAAVADYIKPVVLAGTPGTTNPPALTNAASSTGQWDIPIARWTSASGGGLTGLVDERYYLWGGFTSAARTGGLLPAWPPRVGQELDTGKVFRSDGTTWTQLLEDTGWLTLTDNGPDASAWTPNNPLIYRRLNGVVYLKFSITRTGTALNLSDGDGSAPYVLPVGFRPTSMGSPALGFGNHARSSLLIYVYGDGTLRVYPMNENLPANRRIYGFASFPTD